MDAQIRKCLNEIKSCELREQTSDLGQIEGNSSHRCNEDLLAYRQLAFFKRVGLPEVDLGAAVIFEQACGRR